MEISEFMQSMRAAPGEVALTAGQALARHQAAAGREEPVVTLAEQQEEAAVRMLSAGYSPGALSALAMQAADTSAALEAERSRIAAAARRTEMVMRAHARGDVQAADVPGMLPDDPGSEERAERLEAKMESLRRQMAAVAAVAQRRAEPEDPAEAATRRAHQAFAEVTREMMTGTEAGRAPGRDRRPFPVSRGAAVGPDICPDCAGAGATPAEHAKLCGGYYQEVTR